MKPDNPFAGRSVVITGKLNNYTRDRIRARLLKKVSRRTNFLILGDGAGGKLVKARSLGIIILSEQEFEAMAR